MRVSCSEQSACGATSLDWPAARQRIGRTVQGSLPLCRGQLQSHPEAHSRPRPPLGLPAALPRGPKSLVLHESQHHQHGHRNPGCTPVRRKLRRRGRQLRLQVPQSTPTTATGARASASPTLLTKRPSSALASAWSSPRVVESADAGAHSTEPANSASTPLQAAPSKS